MIILYTVLVLVALSLIVLGIGLWIFSLAKKDIHFTELAPNTGKMIKMGADIVKILFNSKDGHYQDDGALTTGEQNLGFLFNRTGRIFFGISPIYEVFKFNISWSDYAGGETSDGKQKPPSLTEKKECGCTTFKRFYTHAVLIRGAEMTTSKVEEEREEEKEKGNKKIEGEVDVNLSKEADKKNDTSTTRIDAVMLVTMEITNIRDAVYKIPPEGIVFAQADSALEGAFNDYVNNKTWETFRIENKLSQSSDFVIHILTAANPVLATLGIGMKVSVVELKYYDLTFSPENEALAKSQTLRQIAENEGNADIARAQKHKEARKTEGEGEKEALLAVAEVIGKDNIATYANLGLVAKTQLRVYGETKNALPVINTEGDK